MFEQTKVRKRRKAAKYKPIRKRCHYIEDNMTGYHATHQTIEDATPGPAAMFGAAWRCLEMLGAAWSCLELLGTIRGLVFSLYMEGKFQNKIFLEPETVENTCFFGFFCCGKWEKCEN